MNEKVSLANKYLSFVCSLAISIKDNLVFKVFLKSQEELPLMMKTK